jgi:hypothetical protein
MMFEIPVIADVMIMVGFLPLEFREWDINGVGVFLEELLVELIQHWTESKARTIIRADIT